jgi:hypothetical protein
MAAAFPRLEPRVIDALLLQWLHRRWICRVGDRYVGVIPRKGKAIMRPQLESTPRTPLPLWRRRATLGPAS